MEWFGLTDRGRVRPTNQDIYQIEVREENQTALLVVCDGMGGANAGNVASRFAAQSFVEYARGMLDRELDAAKRQALLTHALVQANDTVFSLAGRQPEFRGMGTTLVAALVQGDQVTVLNVGDSRAYLFDGTRLHQLTEDHSYVEEMRRQGRITEADARTHPQKNLITRAVGVEPDVDGDLFEARLAPGEMLLLCSDGLTGMVEDEKIAQTLKDAKTLALAGDALLTLALEGGGRDNITVALFTRGAEEEA
ncbi:Stp1/IreP family PP2C-type Ser/Thr phosphatase [uncultured Agathobaculum sp.]|uniref:Stp1/IreP family PP2C-type Ser/Thr phosphatase n=1 Tax=uncultured Agathobaculum sp. TaxID=2048140 RepID=UPI00261D84D5|nr:Stp1/IreP family PP2C-type Ser/Thr phosphatase [uncultured Agathobaculum sp.]